jgi:hypothetical protein
LSWLVASRGKLDSWQERRNIPTKQEVIMSEKVYPLFEFDQINVRGTLVIDRSKGLVERVFVESVNADGANEYMESLGANFNDYCSCCGSRWYRATRPVGELDNIDVRYSKEPIAVHYIDGSFVIWEPKRYAKPEPTSAEEALAIEDAASIAFSQKRIEERRINEALKPRYNAYASECGADCGPECIAVKPNMFLVSRAIKL